MNTVPSEIDILIEKIESFCAFALMPEKEELVYVEEDGEMDNDT